MLTQISVLQIGNRQLAIGNDSLFSLAYPTDHEARAEGEDQKNEHGYHHYERVQKLL